MNKIEIVCPRCGSSQLGLVENQSHSFHCRGCGVVFPAIELIPQVENGKTQVKRYELSEHPEHAAALGSLIAAWANIEHALCINLTFLLRCAPWHAEVAFYSIANNKARIDMMQALSEYMIGSTEFREPLIKLLDKTRTLAKFRNNFVHKRWKLGTNAAEVYLIEKSGKPDQTLERRVNVSEMDEITKRIMLLAEELSLFCQRYSQAHAHELSDKNMPSALLKKFS